MDVLEVLKVTSKYFKDNGLSQWGQDINLAKDEFERMGKLIKQYEEAIPALVKENEELRAEVQWLKKTADERLSYEWSTDAENERLRNLKEANAVA